MKVDVCHCKAEEDDLIRSAQGGNGSTQNRAQNTLLKRFNMRGGTIKGVYTRRDERGDRKRLKTYVLSFSCLWIKMRRSSVIFLPSAPSNQLSDPCGFNNT